MAARLFHIGHPGITPAASELLFAVGILPGSLIDRHVTGDFGTVSDASAEANREAIEQGMRVLSVYPTAKGDVWVITEADRSATTVLLPSEY